MSVCNRDTRRVKEENESALGESERNARQWVEEVRRRQCMMEVYGHGHIAVTHDLMCVAHMRRMTWIDM